MAFAHGVGPLIGGLLSQHSSWYVIGHGRDIPNLTFHQALDLPTHNAIDFLLGSDGIFLYAFEIHRGRLEAVSSQ